MKKIFLTLVSLSLFACGGSKKVVQITQSTNTTKNIASQKVDSLVTKNEKKLTPHEVSDPIIKIAEKKKKIIEETNNQQDSIQKKQNIIVENDKIEEVPVPLKKKPLSHQSWNSLLLKHVTNDGTVNYKGFKQDRTLLKTYLTSLSENMPTQTWSKADKLAYWLNAYNAFTVKLIIDNYPTKSIKDIKDPWDARFFKLGKKWYNLNEVEHKILRKMGDPRIHFGINCASFSCPTLPNKAFTSKNVNQELEKLTVAFINDPKRNTITQNKIEISKIFSWFAKDFKHQGSLVSFLNKYSKITIQKNASKSFKTYDWSLNE